LYYRHGRQTAISEHRFAAVSCLAPMQLACLPGGLYILPMFFFFIFYIFNGRTRSKKFSGTILDRSSPTFKDLINFVFIWQSLRDIAIATNESRKIGVFRRKIFLVALPFQNGLEYRKAAGHIEYGCIVYKYGDVQCSNSRETFAYFCILL